MNSMKTTNPFDVLGIDGNASDEDVRKAYFQQVRQFSPEKHAEEFKKIREAYDLLKDSTKRFEAEIFSFAKPTTERVIDAGELPPIEITTDALFEWLRHHHTDLERVDFTSDYTEVL